jgi:hypothetical protein
MLREIRLLTIALLVSAPGCGHDEGLGRVEVRGKVTYQGAPVARGLITFHPTDGSKGPSAGTVIINGRFNVSRDKGPTVGPQKVEVKIINAESDSATAADSTLTKRPPMQLKSFSQRVELTNGVNELNFSFPLKPPTPGKSGQQ